MAEPIQDCLMQFGRALIEGLFLGYPRSGALALQSAGMALSQAERLLAVSPIACQIDLLSSIQLNNVQMNKIVPLKDELIGLKFQDSMPAKGTKIYRVLKPAIVSALL